MRDPFVNGARQLKQRKKPHRYLRLRVVVAQSKEENGHGLRKIDLLNSDDAPERQSPSVTKRMGIIQGQGCKIPQHPGHLQGTSSKHLKHRGWQATKGINHPHGRIDHLRRRLVHIMHHQRSFNRRNGTQRKPINIITINHLMGQQRRLAVLTLLDPPLLSSEFFRIKLFDFVKLWCGCGKFSVWLTVNGQRGAIKIRKIALFCSDPDSGAVRTWRPCLCIIVQQRSKIAKSPYRTKGWAPSSVYCMLWHCKPLRCSSA
ncbi:hypothetical protein C8F04DRAFT_1234775 [Mycena alexandri]|uniref:Uncharacterized protein n=1 Tax=Mycena alexandri TaxID=1745969 RepID=A0AAD6ST70_9AGAR|nr:hypothetical protein C8F04DRAFT_1234775 [Mycena alexandri]